MRKKFGVKKIFKILISIMIIYQIIFSFIIPTYKKLNPPKFVKEFNKEQAIEDYNFLWETLESRYPFFNIAKRKLGLDSNQIKFKYLQKINEMENIDIHSFYKITRECLNEFEYLAHLYLFDEEVFFNLKEIANTDNDFVKNSKKGPLFEALFNQKSIDIYNYLKKESLFSNRYFNIPISLTKNFKTKIIDEKTAYLEIYSPSLINEKKDIQALLDFYEDIEKDGIENLIINMHALYSGDYYWMNNIVSPNIDRKKTYKTKVFFLNDDFVKNYYKSTNSQIYENLDNIGYYPKLNKDDLKNFGGYFDVNVEINPMFNKKKFSGNIYLLTDKYIRSSLESFAQFSKQSKFATLVGEDTGGDGYNGGTPMLSYMPNSGLVFFYRIGYGINDDGSSNIEFGTKPDYYSNKGDAPLYTCLLIIKNKSNTVTP